MLDTLCNYTKIICTDKRTNNWGSSAALSMLAAGVFENDTARFNLGKSFYLFLLPYQVEKTGLVMETCRDCNHAEYNMIGMVQAAEVAWHQGVDFYGVKLDSQTTPRLLMGLEFQANSFLGTPINVGQSCGAVSCSGDDLHGPGWEIGQNSLFPRQTNSCSRRTVRSAPVKRISSNGQRSRMPTWATFLSRSGFLPKRRKSPFPEGTTD